eukprot:scaffold82047_cov31-Tisochrysis_lutea.AAC.5
MCGARKCGNVSSSKRWGAPLHTLPYHRPRIFRRSATQYMCRSRRARTSSPPCPIATPAAQYSESPLAFYGRLSAEAGGARRPCPRHTGSYHHHLLVAPSQRGPHLYPRQQTPEDYPARLNHLASGRFPVAQCLELGSAPHAPSAYPLIA